MNMARRLEDAGTQAGSAWGAAASRPSTLNRKAGQAAW